MNELSHPISASYATAQQDIDKKTQTLAARIMADDQIDPFHLYASTQLSPVVLSVPHGGWQYPQSLVTADNFKRCTSLADTCTAELGIMLAGGCFSVLIASCGRAACDLNRPQHALDGLLCADVDTPLPVAFKPYVAAGYGVIPRLSADKQPLYERMLDKTQWQNILSAWHTPYHQTLTDLLCLACTHYEDVFLIDLHSMPDNPDRPSRKRFFPATSFPAASFPGASKRLPDFVFGNLHGATLTQKAVRRIDTVMDQTGFSWHWNTPYAGGYITRHYGLNTKEDNNIPTVEVLQIEVNRRLYTAQKSSQDNAGIMAVKQVIEQIVTALSDD